MSDTISSDDAFNLISFGGGRPSQPAPEANRSVAVNQLPPVPVAPATPSVNPAPQVTIPSAPMPTANVGQQAADIAKQMDASLGKPVPANPISTVAESLGMNPDTVNKVLAGLGLLTLGAGAYQAGKSSGKKSVQERINANKSAIGNRVEPTMGAEPTAPTMSAGEPTGAPAPSKLEQVQAKTQAVQEANMQRQQLAPQPAAPVQPSVQQPAAPAQASAPQPAGAVAPTESKPAPISPKASKPKVETTLKNVSELPAGQTFVPGVGGADSWLHAQAGPEVKQFIRDQFNDGKPYGSGKPAMDKMFADLQKYDKWVRENIPGGSLNRAERIASGVPHPPAYPKLGKVARVGGVLGLIVSVGEAAQAASKGEWGKAADIATDVFVPPFAGSTELAPGTLDGRPESAKAMELSPVPGVGAGRGVAPPSAYLR